MLCPQVIVQRGLALVIFKLTLTIFTSNIFGFKRKLAIQYCFSNANTFRHFVKLPIRHTQNPNQERKATVAHHTGSSSDGVHITRYHTLNMTVYIVLVRRLNKPFKFKLFACVKKFNSALKILIAVNNYALIAGVNS